MERESPAMILRSAGYVRRGSNTIKMRTQIFFMFSLIVLTPAGIDSSLLQSIFQDIAEKLMAQLPSAIPEGGQILFLWIVLKIGRFLLDYPRKGTEAEFYRIPKIIITKELTKDKVGIVCAGVLGRAGIEDRGMRVCLIEGTRIQDKGARR